MDKPARSPCGVQQTLPDTATILRQQERRCGTAGSIVAIWLGVMPTDTSGSKVVSSKVVRRRSSFAMVSTYPQEMEEAFYNHPAVLEVAVIGMPDPVGAGGERVLAFVSLRDGLVTDEQELRDHARQRLADFKIPERVLFLKDLPKGITGKVQRRALKEVPSAAA